MERINYRENEASIQLVHHLEFWCLRLVKF